MPNDAREWQASNSSTPRCVTHQYSVPTGSGGFLFSEILDGQSISYFCDTPMTIRKLSDNLIQIKEPKPSNMLF